MKFLSQYRVLIILLALVLVPLLASEFVNYKAIKEVDNCNTKAKAMSVQMTPSPTVMPTAIPTATPSGSLKKLLVATPTKAVVLPLKPASTSGVVK